MRELKTLVGETVVAISHEPYRKNIGVMNLDVVTGGGSIYRFSTEEIDGERTADGRTTEHYSLTLERVDAPTPADEQTSLVGAILKADVIRSDEWLGPVDHSFASIGANPRPLFDGKVGSCPTGATCVTLICGVVLHSKDWTMLVRTHAFPLHLDFTTEPAVINEFLDRYGVGDSITT